MLANSLFSQTLSSEVFWWLAAASLAMFLASPLIVGVLLVKMPADYFVRRGRPEAPQGRVALRILGKVLKNLAGAILALAGLVMLITPGQGLLALLVGVSLLDVPGKRKLQLRIASQDKVYRAVNKLRARFGKPPYELPRGVRSPGTSAVN